MWKAYYIKVSCIILMFCVATSCRAAQVALSVLPVSSLTPDELMKRGLYYLLNRNRPDSALYYNALLANRFSHRTAMTREERRYTAIGYNRQGYIYMFFFLNYSKAIANFLKAQEYSDDVELQVSTEQNIGHIYSLYAECYPTDYNYSAARYYYKSAFNQALAKHLYEDIVSSFCAFWNLGIDKKNIAAFDKEITLFGQTHIPATTPILDYARNLYQVVSFVKKGDYPHAVTLLHQQLHAKVTNGYQGRRMCFIYWNIAKVYQLADKPDSVLCYARKLQACGVENKMLDVEVDAYRLLLDYYRYVGNREKARDYQLLYFQKRDSLLVMHNLNSVKSNYLLGNIAKLNYKVADLRQQKSLAKTIGLLGGLAGLVVIFVVLLLYRKRAKRKLRHLLSQQSASVVVIDKPKYSSSNLDESEKLRLKELIEEVLGKSDEIYGNEFSLDRLSQLCNTHLRDISQVINEKFGCSFVILISEYRVKEACRRIKDEENFGNLTLEAIGQSVGFKARGSFSRAFKRVMGLSPSDYQKFQKKSVRSYK